MAAIACAPMPAEPVRSPSPFPQTRLSILERMRSTDAPVRRHAFDTLVTAYWKPIYKYLRLRWRMDSADAEDVTQGFLTAAYERQYLDAFDPLKARFRTFLRVCLDRFVQNQQQAASRQKRGGGRRLLPLDFEAAEGELGVREPAGCDEVDQVFRQEVIRALLARAVDAVREQCAQTGRPGVFRLFERYDLEPDEKITYAALAARTGLTAAQVTNHLALARRMFRAAALNYLREMTASDDEFRLEARDLFGMEIP